MASQKGRSLLLLLLLYSCKTWTMLADSEKRIQAFETKCIRKLLYISYLERKTSDWVRSKIKFHVGPQDPLLAAAKRWKLAWFGHVTCHGSLSRTILQGASGMGDTVVSRGNAG